MPIQAATVEVLIEKAHFEPSTAIAIAEAIDVAIVGADLVTVPVLDARFAVLKTELLQEIQKVRVEMQEVKAELVRWVFIVMLGNVALSTAASVVVSAIRHVP